MKRILTAVLMLALGEPALTSAEEPLAGTISLSGAWALYPMAVRWGEEFQKLHPGVRFDISAGGAGKGMTDVLAGAVDIGMVSRDIRPEELDKDAFPVAMTRDAVVAVVNAKNTALAELRKRGVKRDILKKVWSRNSAATWGDVAGTKLKAPVRIYTRSDACGAAQTWAAYLDCNQEDLGGIGVYGDPGLGEAVRKDPVGIGYNNVNFAYDAKTGRPVEGLAILPLDVNGNGGIDEDENFYETRDHLTDAIAQGLYPAPPARDLYFVTRNKPSGTLLAAFITWALTEGQSFVGESGYIRLSDEQLAGGLNSITP